MNFHCETCKLDFTSPPDQTGEQAPCPQCSELALTREFYASERRRSQFSLRTFFIGVFVIAIIVLCCLPIWHRHGYAVFHDYPMLDPSEPFWGLLGEQNSQNHGHPIWDWGHDH